MFTDSIVMIVGVLLLALFAIYLINPSILNIFTRQGFEDMSAPNTVPPGGASGQTTSTGEKKNPMDVAGAMQAVMNMTKTAATGSEGYEDMQGSASEEGYESGPANFGSAAAPAGCYPRDQLQASELLPRDANSVWAQQNPLGPGSLKGVNFLSAGALIGINTVGQSMKNANLQLRSEPPNPQVPVSVFNNSTIEPDFNRRPLEIN